MFNYEWGKPAIYTQCGLPGSYCAGQLPTKHCLKANLKPNSNNFCFSPYQIYHISVKPALTTCAIENAMQLLKVGGTEKVSSRLWRRSCSILFLEIGGKYRYNRKNRCKKICNSKLLSHLENTEFRFPVKAHPILHLL